MMRLIPILLLACTCLVRAGAPIGISDTSWPNLATSLPCSGNLVHWWVASDLTDGAVSTWTDRVGGLAFTQATGANQPTKSGLKVTFGGTHFMYNSPKVAVGGQIQQRTVVIIYKPAGNAAAPQSFWVDGDLGAFGFMISLGGDNKLRWFGGSPEILINSNINDNLLHDFIMNHTGTSGANTIWEIYLDGTSVNTNSGIPQFTLGELGAGSGAANPSYGDLYEIQVYEDCTMTQAQVDSVHAYRVALYGP